MKLSRLFVFIAFLSSTLQSEASWDIYKSGLSVNGGYYDCQLNTAAPDFQNSYFGRYVTGGSLVINFTEVLTFKNGASNVCGANLYYRVYRTSDAPPAFSSLAAGFCCNFGSASACNGATCGPDVNNPGDQKWKGTPGSTINLISGLTLPGSYVFEVYYDATGDDSGGCTNTKFSSNGGQNYRAYFEFENTDSFSDLNFSTPTWTGDVANFTTIANSNTSGLTGSEATRTHTVRLNATGTGTESISTQIATWDQQQEWYFWIGRNNNGAAPQDFDANNQQAVYLYSSGSNLEGAINGYRILMGENATSYIRFQRIDGGVATNLFTSSVGVPNGLTDYGISFKVTRTQLGVWTIRTSTLPTNGTNTQSTPTPNSAVETLSTVNHGSVTDNTYAPAANGYFGFQATHDNSTEGIQAAEFDSFRFRALPPDTYVQINGASTGSIAEDVADFPLTVVSHAIGVDILNPSATTATTVQLVLLSGDAGRAGGGLVSATTYAPSYTTQTLTWAPGASGTKYFYIDPNNNALCDDIATLSFQLQNASGGTNAYVGPSANYTLSIIDDNMGYETLLSDNFESGTLTNWVTNGTAWSSSTTSPIVGTRSARHGSQAASGTTSLSYPLDNANLAGVNSTWRFEATFQNDATANNNFQVFLASTEANLFSATNDGYAVVVDQTSLPSAGSSDFIRLYRVDNGVYATTPIVNSAIDWLDNVNGGVRVGFEVTLNDAGTWNLKVDANGGFDALSSLGTGVDLIGGGITYPIVNSFGMRFKYLPGASNLLALDEVSIAQSGCKEIWYSQGTGNSNAAIWNSALIGAGTTVVSGRYDRFVIQSGHNVTVNGSWVTRSVGINSGGTLTGGTGNLSVYESFANDGTFTAGSSTVTFKGQAAQFVLGGVSTTFNNVVVDNDASSLTLLTATAVNGLVSMEEGTLQTGGILTLNSTSTGSASIGEIKSGAAVSGDITLKRYIPAINNVYGNWVNIGCPLQSQTIEEWDDDVITTGFPGSDYPSYQFDNVQWYDETAVGTMNQGYVVPTTSADALSTSRGYYVWLQGAVQNLDNTGAIQSGPISQGLSYTITSPGGIFDYGWNLMTNPYPSEVDWNLVSSALTGPKVYYVFDHETNAYKYRNASTNSGTASRYIPHSQSILVKVNAAGQALTYAENYKTNTGAAFERSEESDQSFIALQLSRNGMSDESMLLFRNDANNAFEDLDVYDLESLNNDAVEFSLLSADNIALAQDARPFSNSIEIPVRLDLPSAGNYVFTVSEAQNLPFGSCLYVEDLFTGNTMSLLPGESMTISTDVAYSGNRLMIHGTAPITTVVTNPSCHDEADGSLDITTPTGAWSISLSGDTDNYEYVSGGSVTFDHLDAGVYTLVVTNSQNACGPNSTTIEIVEPALVNAEISDAAVVQCNQGSTGRIEWNVENTDWFTYEVFNAANELVRAGEVDGNVGFEEELTADVFSIHIYTTCSTEVLNADLRDPSATQYSVVVPASVVIENGSATIPLNLISNQSALVEWTFSNGMSASGESTSITIAEPGTYSYIVNATADCNYTTTGTFTVASATSVSEVKPVDAISMLQLNNGIQLTFHLEGSKQSAIRMFDAQGREVFSKNVNAANGQIIMIETAQLSAGIYNIQVISAGNTVFASRVYKR